MDPTNPSFWERLGFPLATLILLGIGLIRMARWLNPWVEAVFQNHMSFLKRTADVLEAMLAEQKSQSAAIQSLSHDMSETRLETARMGESIVERLDKIVAKERRA